uniref:Uncharacterized protein n=1 Tax=Glossina pallidipes TaxID=7398 RepID=A0A1B0A9M9_GLOPL
MDITQDIPLPNWASIGIQNWLSPIATLTQNFTVKCIIKLVYNTRGHPVSIRVTLTNLKNIREKNSRDTNIYIKVFIGISSFSIQDKSLFFFEYNQSDVESRTLRHLTYLSTCDRY